MKNSIPLKLIKKIMIMVAMFALFTTGTGVSLICNAVTEGTFTASPLSCSVGDTITLTYSGGSSGSVYQYSYSTNNGSTWVGITSNFSDITTYSFVPSKEGTFIFKVVIKYSGGSLTNRVSNSVIVSSSEISDESSEPESSEPESSISLPFLPSDWEGGGFVQPSAESTPDLSYEDLPSDLDSFEVNEDLTSIIGRAFNAFPQKLIVLMIPTIICLFIGWWLHK